MIIKKNLLISLVITITLTTLTILSSCENDTPTSCPVYNVGAVEGHILALGQGISIPIGARAQQGSRRGQIIAQTVSDTTGWYRMELPTGLYQMELEPRGGTSFSSHLRDTVRVTPNIHHLNMEYGRAEIRIGLPEAFNGNRFHIVMIDSTGHGSYQYERAQDGLLLYSIPVLRPDSYTIRFNGPNVGGRFYLPGTTDSDLADILVVDSQNVTLYEVDFSQNHSSISGQISGSWLEANTGKPHIETHSANNIKLGITPCSDDGGFVCHFFLPEEVRLLVTNNGIEQWIGGNSFETARVFNLQAGDHITDISMVGSGLEILLAGPGDLTSYKPTFLVVDDQGREHTPLFFSSNPFSICNLQPGRYYLKIAGNCDNQSWLTTWFNGAYFLENATPIDLGVGELRQLTVDLVRGGQIQGTVTAFTGDPLGSVLCKLINSKGEPVCDESSGYRSIEGGQFDFKGLLDEEYYLAINAYPCGVSWYPGTANFSEAIPIPIENQTTVTGLNWSLSDCSKEAK